MLCARSVNKEHFMSNIHTQRLRTSSRRTGTSIPAWVWMVGLFVVLIIWQGAFRKWWLPSLQNPLYIAKDVALVGAILLYGARYGWHLTKPLRQTILPVLWGGLAFVVILQIFNFNFPSVLGGIMGARAYLLYTLLLILMPRLLDQVERPERLILWTVSLGIAPVLALGFYQYGQPVDAWINQYVAEEANVHGVLSRPRITGTFSYIQGMGSFLKFALFFALGILLAGIQHRHRLYTWLGAGFLAFALIVAPMNGSRSVVLGLLVPLPFILYAMFRGKGGLYVLIGTLCLGLLGGYIATTSEWATQGWETVGHRIETASDQDTRVQSMLTDPIRKVPVGGLLGYGTGATHPAAGVLAPEGRISIPGVWYEGEFGRVIIELGTIGGLFYFLLKGLLAWFAWQAMNRAINPWESLISITSFGLIFLSFPTSMIIFNHVEGALYWLCAGAVVWVWSRQEERKKAFWAIRQRVRSASNAGRR